MRMKPFATGLCLLAGCTLLPSGAGRAQDAPAFVKKTYTYKAVGDVSIQADVYRADDDEVRPVVVWIHGGALITGNRNSVPRQLLDLCRAEGVARNQRPAVYPDDHRPHLVVVRAVDVGLD